MKFQKLDSKQVPQVVVLGVLCVGVFGYGAFSFLSGSSPSTAQADPARTSESVASAPAPGSADPAAGAAAAGTGSTGPALPAVPGIYNPDPFRPTAKTASAPAPGPAAQPIAPPPNPVPRPRRGMLAALPPLLPGATLPAELETPGVPAPPARVKPERPALTITGVIDVEKGNDMALVEMGQEQRILQVGDVLPNDYRVQRIALDGILLVHSGNATQLPDRYFVGLPNPGAPPSGGSPAR